MDHLLRLLAVSHIGLDTEGNAAAFADQCRRARRFSLARVIMDADPPTGCSERLAHSTTDPARPSRHQDGRAIGG